MKEIGMNLKNISFEEAIEKLDDILKKLENENTPLDTMLTLYEEANKLTLICKDKLKIAEKKMTKLIDKEDTNNIED